MSFWDVIEFGLDVANVAVSLDNAAKIRQMQQQGAASALIQAALLQLRSQIFNLKQTADTILEKEEDSSLLAACAMRILELQLDESTITPDVFQDLSDKDYAAKAIRVIRSNSARMLGALPIPERVKVQNVAEAVLKMPRYEFYINNYSKGIEYLRASEIFAKYKDRQGCLVTVMNLICGLFLLISFGLIGSGDSGTGMFGFLLLISVVGVAVAIGKWQNSAEFNKAKSLLEKTPDFDLDRFSQLDKVYSGIEDAQRRYEKAKSVAGDFFGDNSTDQEDNTKSGTGLFDPLLPFKNMSWEKNNSVDNSVSENKPNMEPALPQEAIFTQFPLERPAVQPEADKISWRYEKENPITREIDQNPSLSPKAKSGDIPQSEEGTLPRRDATADYLNDKLFEESIKPWPQGANTESASRIQGTPNQDRQRSYPPPPNAVAETLTTSPGYFLKPKKEFPSLQGRKYLVTAALTFIIIAGLGTMGFLFGGVIYNITSATAAPATDINVVMTQAVQTALAEITNGTPSPAP